VPDDFETRRPPTRILRASAAGALLWVFCSFGAGRVLGLAPVATFDRSLQASLAKGPFVLQFLTSWPLLVAVAMLLMALVLLIEPAAPFGCEGLCSDWPVTPGDSSVIRLDL
jgi:hypothetical protein